MPSCALANDTDPPKRPHPTYVETSLSKDHCLLVLHGEHRLAHARDVRSVLLGLEIHQLHNTLPQVIFLRVAVKGVLQCSLLFPEIMQGEQST